MAYYEINFNSTFYNFTDWYTLQAPMYTTSSLLTIGIYGFGGDGKTNDDIYATDEQGYITTNIIATYDITTQKYVTQYYGQQTYYMSVSDYESLESQIAYYVQGGMMTATYVDPTQTYDIYLYNTDQTTLLATIPYTGTVETVYYTFNSTTNELKINFEKNDGSYVGETTVTVTMETGYTMYGIVNSDSGTRYLNGVTCRFLNDNVSFYVGTISKSKPVLGDVISGNVGLTICACTFDQMTEVTSMFTDQTITDYSQYVYRIYSVPLWLLPQLCPMVSIGAEQDVLIYKYNGGVNWPITLGRGRPLTQKNQQLYCTFTLTRYYNDYRDYEPYSTYKLRLPFTDDIELDPAVCLDTTISVYAAFAITTGVLTYLVYSDNTLYKRADTDISYQITLVSDNTTGLERIGTAIGTLGGTLGAALSGNYVQAASAAISGVSSLAQMQYQNVNGVSAGYNKYFGDNHTELIVDRKVRTNNSFKTVKGIPYNQYATLGDLKGFTVASDFHLDFQAYDEEKRLITEALRNGVILPDD